MKILERKMKKIFVAFISLTMSLSMMPVSVFATDPVNIETSDYEDDEAGEHIYIVTSDTTFGSVAIPNKDESGAGYHFVIDNCTATINNNFTMGNDASLELINGGNVVFDGGCTFSYPQSDDIAFIQLNANSTISGLNLYDSDADNANLLNQNGSFTNNNTETIPFEYRSDLTSPKWVEAPLILSEDRIVNYFAVVDQLEINAQEGTQTGTVVTIQGHGTGDNNEPTPNGIRINTYLSIDQYSSIVVEHDETCDPILEFLGGATANGIDLYDAEGETKLNDNGGWRNDSQDPVVFDWNNANQKWQLHVEENENEYMLQLKNADASYDIKDNNNTKIGSVAIEVNNESPTIESDDNNDNYPYKLTIHSDDTITVTLTPETDYYGTLSLGNGDGDINVNSYLAEDTDAFGTRVYTFNANEIFDNTDHLELNAKFLKEFDEEGNVANWYTISYGTSHNINIRNGSVVAQRVHVGDTTYTNIASEVDESNHIYAIDETIGKDTDSNDTKPIRSDKYGISYSDGDIMINSANIEAHITIDYVLTPDFGYQLDDVYVNESTSLLDQFEPGTSVSYYTFETMPNKNIHFGVDYVKTNNTVTGNASTGVSVASTNAANSGTLQMTVNNASVTSGVVASGSETAGVYDITLSNVVSKGEDRGNWSNTLTDLGNNSATVTLPLTVSDDYTYSVVREHEGEAATTISSTVSNNTISFETNKFSKYTIVKTKKATTITPTLSKAGDTVVADNGSTVTLLSTGAVSTKMKNVSTKSVTVPSTVTVGGKTYKVTTLKGDAFDGKVVKSVTLPKSITKLNAKTFAGDKKLTTIKVNSKKLTIGKNIFKGISKKQKAKIKVTVNKKNMSKKNFYALRKALMKQGIKYRNIKRK